MKFNVCKQKFANYAVYLDGVIQKHAIEADDSEGWVRTERTMSSFFARPYQKKEIKYGRVHIVKMIDYDYEHFRAKDLILKEDKIFEIGETD